MKRQEAETIIEKAQINEINEITKKQNKKSGYKNCAGYSSRSLNLKSNVKMLAIKCYEEQMPKGWEYVKMKLRNLDKHQFQVVAIRHDADTVENSDFFQPSIEKPHYHILIRYINPNGTLNRNGTTVNKFLKGTGIVFRPCDTTLIANHGIETVENWCGYVLYLTHETERAFREGKHIYDRADVVSNLSDDEVNQFREGYTRVSAECRKISKTDIAEIAKTVYELGNEMKDFYAWYNAQPALVQSHSKMNYWKSRYEDGVKDYIEKNGSDVKRLCIYIKGSHGVGKTRTSGHVLQDMGYKWLQIGGGGTGKYDDIKCTTQALLIDDDTAPNVLTMAQNQICKAYKRGNGNPYWTGELFVVTSNLDIDDWALKCGAEESELASVRDRFYICETVKAGSKTRLKVIEPSTRGNEDEQVWAYELFKKFQTMFHEDIDKFQKPKKMDFSDLNDFELKKVLEDKLNEIIQAEKVRIEKHLKIAYELGFINFGQYNEKTKKSEKLLDMLREKHYDILYEAQAEHCIGYPCITYLDNGFMWEE